MDNNAPKKNNNLLLETMSKYIPELKTLNHYANVLLPPVSKFLDIPTQNTQEHRR